MDNKIFITLGSQKFQFNRLLKAVDELCEKGTVDAEDVFAQIGYSDYLPKNFSYKKFLDRDEFSNEMEKANIVITHGGTGAIIGAVKRGKKVIAVPRLAKYGEHVDDHQLQLIKQFDDLNLICSCHDVGDLETALDTVQQTKYNSYKSNTINIINSIEEYTTSVRTLPEDKWIIAENAHAAIVTKDEYYQAQKAIRNVTPIRYKVGDDFALKGKICCGNCNRQLRHERQYGEMVFYCGYKRSAGKFSKCYGGYYREYSVNAKVARAIKTVFYALDVVNQGMQEKQSITVRCVDIEDLEKQAEVIRVEQIKLYELYADGVLLRDAYIEKKKALSEKLAVLQDSIRTEKEEQECADELDEEIRALTKQASEKTYIGGLTKECVDAFVSMVYLYDDQTMKIEFNCEDVIRRALEKYGA